MGNQEQEILLPPRIYLAAPGKQAYGVVKSCIIRYSMSIK